MNTLATWQVVLATQQTTWSPELYHILQLPTDTVASMSTYRACMEPDAVEQLDARLQRALVAREPFTLDHEARCAKGQQRYLRLQAVVDFDANGSPMVLRGTVQDISDLQKAEQERELLALAAAKTDDAVLILNHLGRVQWVNFSFTNVTGYTTDDVLNTLPLEKLMAPGLNDEALVRIAEGMLRLDSFEQELQLTDKFGKIFWARMRFSPHFNHKNVLLNYIVLLTDISQRKQQEQEMQRLNTALAERNEDILAGIRYARRIQSALLPPLQVVQQGWQFLFLSYLPKDILSGDFYWAAEKEGCHYLAVADCTGHGVPGAVMSMLGHAALNEALKLKQDPAAILTEIDLRIQQALEQQGATLQDGMDMALLKLDVKTGTLLYAGANRPILVLKGSVLEEIAPDKQPVGPYVLHAIGQAKAYTNHTFALESGMRLFLFSDGITDQFNPHHKKFGKQHLRDQLVKTAHLPLPAQGAALMAEWESWKATEAQTDDIILLGLQF